MRAEQWPSSGRMVHIDDHDVAVAADGTCIPAVIVRPIGLQPSEWVDLVPLAGRHHGEEYRCRQKGVTSAPEPVTWHWPEYVGPLTEVGENGPELVKAPPL